MMKTISEEPEGHLWPMLRDVLTGREPSLLSNLRDESSIRLLERLPKLFSEKILLVRLTLVCFITGVADHRSTTDPENTPPEELRAAMDAVPNKRSFVRFAAIRMLLMGIPRASVGAALFRTDRVVRLWIEYVQPGWH